MSKKRRKAVGQGDSDRRRLGLVGEGGKDDDDDGKEANRHREIQGVVVVVEVLEACVRHT